MFSRLIVRPLCAALLIATYLSGAERNVWPFAVQQVKPDGGIESAEYLGPLFFEKHAAEGSNTKGFRPFYLHAQEGKRETTLFLYPFVTWQRDGDYRSFTFFELINFRSQSTNQSTARSLDVWPLYFSRDTGDPASSYRALFPLMGTIKGRFSSDRIQFVLFPLYARAEKKERHVTHAPWPFLRFIDGGGEQGFEFWPLFGHRGRAGDYDRQFFLWPLVFKSTKNLSEAQPDVKLGVLPFYSRETRPGYQNENYAWPFFGYTHQTAPVKYDETRYLWPFLVQGRGDVSHVNRWAPLYTHSVIKGVDKTWLAWPIFRHSEWTEAGVAQTKDQVLFRLYWSLTQRSLTNPAAAPASKTHLWPLFSAWNNGAGRRQIQVLSPFEVLFQNNEAVRQLYSPLFALYRLDQRAPDDTRHALLFRLVTWKNTPTEKEFHFGPLFSRDATADRSKIAIGLGLLSWQRQSLTGRWKFSLFDFHSPSASAAPTALSP